MEQKNEENVVIEKKIYVFSIFILTLLILLSILISYLLLNNEIDEIKNNNFVIDSDIPVYENIDDEIEEISIIYMLKEYNGKIGVFENEALVYTLDTYIFTLPEVDKHLLMEGIVLTSKNELYELIEEYY